MTERWWWLSFCDATKPKGQQFIGVSLVRADSFPSAIRAAWARGCNPGGEVQAQPDPTGEIEIPDAYAYRVLTRDEAEELDALIAAVRTGDN